MVIVRGCLPVQTCFTCSSVELLLSTVVAQDGSLLSLKDTPFLSCSSLMHVLKMCGLPIWAMAFFIIDCAIACLSAGTLDRSTLGIPLSWTDTFISHSPSLTLGRSVASAGTVKPKAMAEATEMKRS